MKSIFVLLLLCGFAVSSTAAAAQSSAASADTSAFRVGDAIRITVFGNSEFSGEFEIGLDGTILSPFYRDVQVVGRTIPSAEAAIRAVLSRELTSPKLLVEPLFRVPVTGEVRSPNIYTVAPQTNVVQAVTLAGGGTETARLNRVRLLRGGGEMYIDLTRPHTELAETRLRSGDQIIVDERQNVWREYISPALSTVGSLASLTYLMLRLTRGR